MAFGDSLDLLFKIKADSSQGVGEMKDFRTSFEREVKGIKSAGENAFLSFGKSLGFSAENLAQVKSALPLVGAAVAGVGAAAVGAGAALFGLVKHASDAGSQLYDLSKATGINAESLSALKFAAEQSGSSIEELTLGINQFQKRLGEAARGENKDLLALANILRIDLSKAVSDSEFAASELARVLNGEMPAGYNKTTLAQELAGRSGAKLISTMETIGTSMEAFIEKARRLGVTLTEEDIKAADEFGDTLDALGAKAEATANKFGLRLAPAITHAMEQASGAVERHQGLMNLAIAGTVGWIETEIKKMEGLLSLIELSLAMNPLTTSLLGLGGSGARPTDAPKPKPQFSLFESDAKAVGVFKKQEDIDKELEKAAKERERRESELRAARIAAQNTEIQIAQRIYAQDTANLKEQFEQRLINFEDYKAKAVKAAEDLQKATLEAIDAERREGGRQSTSADPETNRLRELTFQRELDNREVSAKIEFETTKERIDKEGAEQRIETLQQSHDRAEQLERAHDRRRITALSAAAEARTITEAEAEEKIYQIQLAALAREQSNLEKELIQAGAQKELNEELNHELNLLFERRAALFEEHGRRMEEKRRRDLENERRYSEELRRIVRETVDLFFGARRSGIDAQTRTADRERDPAERINKLREIAEEASRLEAAIEEKRHADAMTAIDDRRREIERGGATEEQKLELQRALNAQIEAEDARHRQAMRDNEEADRERRRDIDREEELEDPTSNRSLFGGTFSETLNETGSVLGALGETAKSVFDEMAEAGVNMTTLVGGAIQGLTSGLGGLIQTWVLTGQMSGKAVRAMAANVLAALAQQAIGKAIWHGLEAISEYAMGMSDLANPFMVWHAPFHFNAMKDHLVAAAAFGALGVGSALLGRIAAPSAGGGGSATGASVAGTSRAGGGSDEDPNFPRDYEGVRARREREQRENDVGTRREERGTRAASVQVVEHTMKVEHTLRLPDGYIVDTWVQDYRYGGKSRETIRTDRLVNAT